MKVLLFVLGLLALASGGLKFRGRIMHKIGTSPFAMGELGLGLLACATAILAESVVLQSVVAAATLIVVFVGSYHQSKLTAAFRHPRDLSESHRLRRFVEADPSVTQKPSPGQEHGA